MADDTYSYTTSTEDLNDPLRVNLAKACMFYISQYSEPCEFLAGCETLNRYIVHNEEGTEFLIATEVSDCTTKLFLGLCRPMEIIFSDIAEEQELMALNRPCAFTSDQVRVGYPPGLFIGTVSVDACCKYCSSMVYHISNAKGREIMTIKTPCLVQMRCDIWCCNDVFLDVVDKRGTRVGIVTKKFPGYCREKYSNYERFGCTFPSDLKLKNKVLLVAACLLVDLSLFEEKGDNMNDLWD